MAKNVNTADVAKRIKDIRILRKISQEKMAEMLDMTFSNYTKMENAYQNITIKHLKNICKILDVSADSLLFGKINGFDSLNFNDYVEFASIFNEHELKRTIGKWQQILKLKNK